MQTLTHSCACVLSELLTYQLAICNSRVRYELPRMGIAIYNHEPMFMSVFASLCFA